MTENSSCLPLTEGILLVNKQKGKSSFSIIVQLRKLLCVKKIGHSGTLDPFATGVMVMLIGKKYTRLSQNFSKQEKEYIATLHLGYNTDTYDIEGKQVFISPKEPSLQEVIDCLSFFQGNLQQIPPMYCAKKIKGKKLYELARKGINIARQPVNITVKTELLDYQYPLLQLKVICSSGTYIRSLGYDIGQKLQTGAFLQDLCRTRCGNFFLKDCIDQEIFFKQETYLNQHIRIPQ